MGGRHPQSRHFITAQEPVYRTGSQSYWERLLCAQGSPPALLSTQGLREGTGTEMTLVGVRAEEWPVVTPRVHLPCRPQMGESRLHVPCGT